jgi:predicted RNA-binding Zn ribbon-like protein
MRKSEKHQNHSSQKEASDERKQFVFLGGNLALDLVNTEIMVRGKKVDQLVTTQDATLWWEMAQQKYPQAIQKRGHREYSEPPIAALHALRQELRLLFEALIAQQPVHENQLKELNTILREGYYTLEVTPQGKVAAVYRTRDNQGGEALLAIAHAAMNLITTQDLSRLHACQNERCMLLFYDTTKSATRHWCSVACTNRARSLENYREAKKALLS